MKIKFCGAAREVTGTSHLITLDNGTTILMDCGLYQGNSPDWQDYNTRFLFDPSKIDFLIVSHAHIDHTGRIPMLYKFGFSGEIVSTHATRDLCSIMMMDSAKIQMSNRKRNERRLAEGKKVDDDETGSADYDTNDVLKVMNQFTGISYDRWFNLTEGVRLLFKDTGHILGSASITLEVKEAGKQPLMFGFSGDIGRPNRPILRDPQPIPEVDFMVTESTYGDKEHESAPSERGEFLEIVHKVCVEQGGRLLIPAFSVGRTQEVVFMLDQLVNDGKLPAIPVFVDSPLAVDATEIFARHPECYDEDLQDYLVNDPNPFGFKSLRYIRTSEESKTLNSVEGPCIIISTSGMMNSGRIQHHLRHAAGNPNNAVLLVGYAAGNTPAGQLRQGAQFIYLFGEKIEIKLKTYSMDSFSAHGDRMEMFDFLKNQIGHAKQLFLVHGELDTQEKFKVFLEEKGFRNIEIPSLGQEFELSR